jgi:hypothetical protein
MRTGRPSGMTAHTAMCGGMAKGGTRISPPEKPPTSSHPFSAERKFDGGAIVSRGSAMVACAAAVDPYSTKAIRTAIA